MQNALSKPGVSLWVSTWCRQAFPGGTSGKEPTCQRRRHKRPGFNLRVRKIPWRWAWQPSRVFLPRESHEQKSKGGYSPQGRTESDTTEATQHARTLCRIPYLCVLILLSWLPCKAGGNVTSSRKLSCLPSQCQTYSLLTRPQKESLKSSKAFACLIITLHFCLLQHGPCLFFSCA